MVTFTDYHFNVIYCNSKITAYVFDMPSGYATFSGSIISIDSISVSRFNHKESELAYPTISTPGLWNAARKDYETTSPRIYVNRRTPSCLLIEFSRFECTRQKRVASFSIRVLRVHVGRGSKNDRVTTHINLGAKIRNNSNF